VTAVDLSAIRAQLAGITPGPWEFVGPDIEQCGEVFGTVIENSVDCGSYCYGGSVKQEVKAADAAFIAAAPSTVAGLLAVVERVEALASAWEARGEHDMKFSKTIPDEDIAMHLLTEGASMVENARHIRNAIRGNA